MIKSITSCLLVLFASLSFGQHNNDRSFVNIPPNPVSSKFKLYTDNQPNLSNGSVNIPVDLFDISVYNFRLPLQLIYNTSGINVMDSPVPYGYGWQLNLNPRVTRHLLGKADEQYPFKNNYDPNNSNWGSRNTPNAGDFGDYYEPLKGIATWQDFDTYQLKSADLFDPQKDIFTIQLPNKSVNFFLDWNNSQPIVRTFGNSLQISLIIINKGIEGLKVVDEDGIIYKFGNLNGETSKTYLEDYDGVNLSWLLRDIELINGQKISFEWIEKNTSATKPSISSAVSITDWKLIDMGDGYDDEATVDDLGGMINIGEYFSNFSKMLSKISFPLGSLNFAYKSSNEPLVTEIILRNRNDQPIHQAIFTYGPRNSAQDHLLLQGLRVDNQVFSFNYNANRFSKGSTSLDLWGFFNGIDQNSHIPVVNLKKFNNYYVYHSSPSTQAGVSVGLANKSVDTAKMKALILEKIVYPTGGYTRYEYEPHRFTFAETYPGFFVAPSTPSVGGGLRVKNIRFYNNNDSLEFEKSYGYGKSESGLANIKLIPTLNTFVDEKFHFMYNFKGAGWSPTISSRNLSVKSLSDYSSFDFGRSSFWYDQVTEYSSGGKMITDFIFTDDSVSPLESAKLFHKRYTSTVSTLFQGGPKVLKETILKKVGSLYDTLLCRDFEYDYIQYTTNNTQNLLIDRRIFTSNLGALGRGQDVLYPSNADFWPFRFNSASGAAAEFDRAEMRFNIGYYTINPAFYRLKAQKETTYSSSGKTIDRMSYTYDVNRHNYIAEMHKTSSELLAVQMKYRYPWDFSTSIAQLMVQKNMINVPFEVENSVNQSVSIRKNIFGNELGITNGLILLKEQREQINANLKKISIVSKFDKYGNPLELTINNGSKEVFLWGYNGHYLVAKIENASYSDVFNVLGQTNIDKLNLNAISDIEIDNMMVALRNHVNMKNTMITSYTYKSLIGMSSKTDAKGITEYYDYDSTGKLVSIRDYDGNILKTFCYNYSGQKINCHTSDIYQNVSKSRTFQKNNCPLGQEGSIVNYIVPSGKYSSTVSQASADLLAENDLTTNGQAFANLNGSCVDEVFKFYIYNSSSFSVNLEFVPLSVGGTAAHFDVASGAPSSISIKAGRYRVIAWGPVEELIYQMNCGHSAGGQYYTFEDVILSGSGCTKLDILNN